MSEDSDETLADDAVEADLEAAETDVAAENAETAETADEGDEGEEAAPVSEAKAKADAVIAERKVVARRTVTSRRVTPKGGPAAAKAKASTDAPPASTSKARDAKKTASVTTKAPVATPQQVYAKGPSPWWVPAIMFGLLILGALIIMTNYMGVFGDASNVRLVIGLGFILGGIVTATQYR